ncbi:MAG: rane protein [Pelosinus sp.]|nr:rane protein [Pelosinus sp.]MDF2855451.1 rane protein [Neobacillus sp.]
MSWIYPLLANRSILKLLLVVNIAGTVYGYYWYGWQLEDTPGIFLAFVPDSPTASLFFVFVLIAFLMRKNWPLIEALAIVTLFKYGIWAVVMNMLVFLVQGELDWIGVMLIGSHLAMAVQGLLYAPFYRFKWWHLLVTAVWTLHNDVIDYVFFMMPRYHMLNDYNQIIGYFTFWLSVFSIALAYYFVLRPNRYTLEIK